jgi:hypothetical protein
LEKTGEEKESRELMEVEGDDCVEGIEREEKQGCFGFLGDAIQVTCQR